MAFIVAVAYLKGGVRKTTSATMLAFSLAEKGKNVCVIDADMGTQGVVDWGSRVYAAGGELPFHVAQWSPSQGLLVKFVQEQARETEAEIVIMDIGGEAPEVVAQAVHVADLVVSPVGCEQAELSRVDATRSIVKGQKDLPWRILLTRVPQPRKGTARDVREALTAGGCEVLQTEIPHNKDVYSHVWGTVPEQRGAYDDLAAELESLMERIH